MAFFGIAAGCEAIAAAAGWNEALYRTWYLTGAVLTAGLLGLGTAVLRARKRSGYAFEVSIFLAGLFTLLTQAKNDYPNAGIAPILYFLVGIALAIAIGIATYFQDDRWTRIAAAGVVGASLLGLVLMVTTQLAAPYELAPETGQPVATLFPGSLRLLTPFLNITGAFSLAFGALFSAYTFMPKRRVLDYSLDPRQPGDYFQFNLFIGIVAIAVNFVASIPGAVAAFRAGRLHSRVVATILIAIGGFVASGGDALNRFGVTGPFAVAKFISVVFLLWGFLASIDAFRDIRVPFTSIRLSPERQERGSAT